MRTAKTFTTTTLKYRCSDMQYTPLNQKVLAKKREKGFLSLNSIYHFHKTTTKFLLTVTTSYSLISPLIFHRRLCLKGTGRRITSPEIIERIPSDPIIAHEAFRNAS